MFEVHNCPACGQELCRTDTRWSWSRAIGVMEDAMDAHLPGCGPSNTPEVNAAAERAADVLRRMAP
jgi:hypothetical protein